MISNLIAQGEGATILTEKPQVEVDTENLSIVLTVSQTVKEVCAINAFWLRGAQFGTIIYPFYYGDYEEPRSYVCSNGSHILPTYTVTDNKITVPYYNTPPHYNRELVGAGIAYIPA